MLSKHLPFMEVFHYQRLIKTNSFIPTSTHLSIQVKAIGHPQSRRHCDTDCKVGEKTDYGNDWQENCKKNAKLKKISILSHFTIGKQSFLLKKKREREKILSYLTIQ